MERTLVTKCLESSFYKILENITAYISVKKTHLDSRYLFNSSTFPKNHHLNRHHSHQDTSPHGNNFTSKIYSKALKSQKKCHFVLTREKKVSPKVKPSITVIALLHSKSLIRSRISASTNLIKM